MVHRIIERHRRLTMGWTQIYATPKPRKEVIRCYLLRKSVKETAFSPSNSPYWASNALIGGARRLALSSSSSLQQREQFSDCKALPAICMVTLSKSPVYVSEQHITENRFEQLEGVRSSIVEHDNTAPRVEKKQRGKRFPQQVGPNSPARCQYEYSRAIGSYSK